MCARDQSEGFLHARQARSAKLHPGTLKDAFQATELDQESRPLNLGALFFTSRLKILNPGYK